MRSGNIEIPGLASLDVSTASALARWTGDGSCPAPGQPLTRSSVSTADVSTAAATPGIAPLLEVPGTVSTEQSVTLQGAGTRRVVSEASGSAADVKLLAGRLQVAVADAPTLTATASGEPGGAEVVWDAPVVRVTLGDQVQELPADGSPVDFTTPENPLLNVELSIGQLTDVRKSADGTRASGHASVLHAKVELGGAGLGVTVLETGLFPLSASATAPAGGVRCGAGSQDADGDGLTDDEETSGDANEEYGGKPTDPQKADSDGDGLTDGEEVSGSENEEFDATPTDPNRADTDGDRLSDGAETSGSENGGFGNAPTDPTAPDTDGGSVDDGDEVDAGTNPNNPADDVLGGGDGGGDGDGDGGGDGGDGPTVDDPDADGLPTDQETEEGTNPVIADTDGDGLTDGEEVEKHETEPTDPDTDRDRLTDGEEVDDTATDPLDRDTDRDGLRDGREVLDVTTDPNDKDTDNDRLGDGREVKRVKTDPKDRDTDGDRLGDGREVRGPAPNRYPDCETNPKRKDSDRDMLNDRRELKRTDTDPCDKDSDDGGISDGREVKAGSDPNDPHSTPKNPRGHHTLASRLLGPTG